MWKYSIHLVFLIIFYTIVPGYSHVVFNRVFFGCIGDEETLQMRCRVNDLGLGAYIFHRSKELAQCIAFPNNSCYSITGNINITSSSDVVYTIDSRQRQILNGSWTCRNGAGEKNENSSLEVFSTKCESSSPLSNCGSSSRPSNCLMEKDDTAAGIMLLVLPLIVFGITVFILHCCQTSGQNDQTELEQCTDLLLVKVSCLWVCGNNKNNEKREIGCKSVWCFFLFGVYVAVVTVFYYSKMSADVRIGLLVFATFLGIFVAFVIPVIWKSRGSTEEKGSENGGSQLRGLGTDRKEPDERKPLMSSAVRDNPDDRKAQPVEAKPGNIKETADTDDERHRRSTSKETDTDGENPENRKAQPVETKPEKCFEQVTADIHVHGDDHKITTTPV